MVEQLTLQTIGILLTGISITAAAIYYIMFLRNTIMARKTQLAMQLLSQFNKDFYEPWTDVMIQQDFSSYEEWRGKYDPYVNPKAANNLYGWWRIIRFIDTK